MCFWSSLNRNETWIKRSFSSTYAIYNRIHVVFQVAVTFTELIFHFGVCYVFRIHFELKKKERITFNCLCFFIYAWESNLCSYFKKWFYQASFDVMSKSIGSLFYVSIDAHKRIMCTVKSRLFGSFSFSFFKKGSFWITHLLKKKSDQCKRELVKKKKKVWGQRGVKKSCWFHQ